MKYEEYMHIALAEAERAQKIREVPIGAIIISKSGKVIGKGHNLRETKGDPTLHAEMVAIQQAAEHMGGWRLNGCTLFTTLEPCPMCAGAIVQARIEQVVFGANDPKAGCGGSLMNLLEEERFNHQCVVIKGVLETECKDILKDFFRNIRNRKD